MILFVPRLQNLFFVLYFFTDGRAMELFCFFLWHFFFFSLVFRDLSIICPGSSVFFLKMKQTISSGKSCSTQNCPFLVSALFFLSRRSLAAFLFIFWFKQFESAFDWAISRLLVTSFPPGLRKRECLKVIICLSLHCAPLSVLDLYSFFFFCTGRTVNTTMLAFKSLNSTGAFWLGFLPSAGY